MKLLMPENEIKATCNEVGTAKSDRIERINRATQLYLQKVLSGHMCEELWELMRCGAVSFQEREEEHGKPY